MRKKPLPMRAPTLQSRDLDVRYGFLANPGVIAAFNPLSELDSDAHQLRYLTVSMVPAFFHP